MLTPLPSGHGHHHDHVINSTNARQRSNAGPTRCMDVKKGPPRPRHHAKSTLSHDGPFANVADHADPPMPPGRRRALRGGHPTRCRALSVHARGRRAGPDPKVLGTISQPPSLSQIDLFLLLQHKCPNREQAQPTKGTNPTTSTAASTSASCRITPPQER